MNSADLTAVLVPIVAAVIGATGVALQRRGGRAAFGVDQREEQVLAADVSVPQQVLLVQ